MPCGKLKEGWRSAFPCGGWDVSNIGGGAAQAWTPCPEIDSALPPRPCGWHCLSCGEHHDFAVDQNRAFANAPRCAQP